LTTPASHARRRSPARDGAWWARAGDRLVEVERFIPHDATMTTLHRLARGLPLLDP